MTQHTSGPSKIEAAINRARRQHKEAAEAWKAGSPAAALGPEQKQEHPLPGKQLLSVESFKPVPMDLAVATANRILGAKSGARTGQSEYRMLRTRLMQRMRSHGWQVLGVCAAGEGEGKSLTAINLAISIAAEVGQEAVLLELDLRRPGIHKLMGISPLDFNSVSTYLQQETHDIRELLIAPGIERLGCVLCSASLERPSDLLASSRGQQLFKELRRQLLPSTIIIVDLPPLLSADDALVVAPMMDALLFVVAEGQTKRSDLAEARHLLAEINVIGTVLNKSVETDPRKYY
jgi:protein-tyrosine kinase